MKLLAWGIEEDLSATTEKAKYLISTANKYGIQVHFVGEGTKYTADIDKLFTLRQYLEKIDEDELVVCIDAYDTLINRSLVELENEYINLDTEVVISGERLFTYQWHTFQDKFELIESPYRYVNAGTLLGRCEYVRKMVDECIRLLDIHKTKVDQGVLGVWVYQNIDNTKKVKLDTSCQFFWVTSAEHQALKEVSENSSIIKNNFTNTTPYVIHSTGNGAHSHFQCFQAAHKNIMNRRL